MFLRKTLCVAVASIWMLAAIPNAHAVTGGGSEPGAKSSDPFDTDWGSDPWAADASKPLFPEALFPKEETTDTDMRLKLSGDIKRINTEKAQTGVRAGQDNGRGGGGAHGLAYSEADSEMKRQMRSVAHWLYLYCLRNRQQFPGADGSTDELWAAQAQLTMLCPNNPYNYGPTETINWGIPATFNANGSAATGSPVWNDQYQQGLHANQQGRVLLQWDAGLNPATANYYADHPPDTWTAAPGTITAIGNNQGFFIVWGADHSGKALKTALNGKTFVISASSSGTVNDTSAPNSY